ncbi:MAG: magnesium transporter CorA family protein, partial [Lachnospiraceae bacterium]
LEDVARIRGDLLAMRTHYEQLLDLGQELDENENGFFKEENLRYFSMFCARIMRLQDYVTTLREISVQVRDLYQSQLSEKQNRIMTILTVVTTIFTPLTLVTGWYGMNFKYMPELEWEYSYPVVFLISLGIALGCLLFFKIKKWL